MRYYVIPNINEIDKYLDLAKKYNLGFEYNEFYNPLLLDNKAKLDETINQYKILGRTNDTLHGVFYDICLDSVDPKIKDVSYLRVKSSMEIAKKLNCKGVIFHTNYITWMKTKEYRNNWVNVHKEIFLKLIKEYPNIDIYVENMFDLNPYLLGELMLSINNKRIGVCLDIAHASISDVELKEWFRVLGNYIKHIHINDNDRIVDSHQELGLGNLDFEEAFKYINKLPDDTTILIEISDYEKTVNSINFLKAGGFNAFE